MIGGSLASKYHHRFLFYLKFGATPHRNCKGLVIQYNITRMCHSKMWVVTVTEPMRTNSLSYCTSVLFPTNEISYSAFIITLSSSVVVRCLMS